MIISKGTEKDSLNSGILVTLMLLPFCYFAIYLLSQSTWVAITKYHGLCGLNNKHLFLRVVESGKLKLKTTADSVSDESPHPAHRLPSSPCIFTWWKGIRCQFMNLRGHIHCLASTFFEAFEIMTLPSEILEHKFSINKDIFQHNQKYYP